MSFAHVVQAMLVRGAFASFNAMSWQRSLGVGAALGYAVQRAGLRTKVAEDNLARALPERSADERRRILADSYRELGRVVAEYARLPELGRAPVGEVIAETNGLEHVLQLRGRGVLLITGHYGNFELLASFMSQFNPLHVVARKLRNARVEAFMRAQRETAGMRLIEAGRGRRKIYDLLRSNQWVAMLGDQDGGRRGAFVPFFGRPASTMIGPARFALAAGVPMVFGVLSRRADGKHVVDFVPPLEIPDRQAPDAAEQLTALHARTLEAWVRQRPASWFWLHRRWKSQPPLSSGARAPATNDAAAEQTPR